MASVNVCRASVLGEFAILAIAQSSELSKYLHRLYSSVFI